MADIEKLYNHRKPEDVLMLLVQASSMAKKNRELGWSDIQNTLHIGAGEAVIILDWLADNNEAHPKISKHWVRAGRAYVRNNPLPSLATMAWMLEVGERRAFLIMQELERRKLIRIKEDFTFERVGRMASFNDLVRQMKVVAKRFHGRCEPSLLIRTLYIEPYTATRLAQYGEECLSLRWKNRPKDML